MNTNGYESFDHNNRIAAVVKFIQLYKAQQQKWSLTGNMFTLWTNMLAWSQPSRRGLSSHQSVNSTSFIKLSHILPDCLTIYPINVHKTLFTISLPANS